MTIVHEKRGQENIVDIVRSKDAVITSKNSAELSRRIDELSAEFLAKNSELYKRLETR